MWIILLLLAQAAAFESVGNFNCHTKTVAHGTVCECTVERPCSRIPNSKNSSSGHATVITSQSLDIPDSLGYLSVSSTKVKVVKVPWRLQPEPSSQNNLGTPILGFGGAFTDAAAYHLYHTINSPELRQQLINRYFHPTFGIGYNIGRVPMGSTDFSKQSYALHTAGIDDEDLVHFCLRDDRPRCNDLQSESNRQNPEKHDPTSQCGRCGDDYKLDLVLWASRTSKKNLGRSLRDLRLFFSPWSAPPYMKTSAQFAGGSLILSDNRVPKLWAKIFVRFATEWGRRGAVLWGLTVQNEPTKKTRWEHMNWKAADIADFVFDHLGPTVRSNNNTSDLKIITYDDQPCTIGDFQGVLMERARKNHTKFQYIDGIGYHWYTTLAASVENSSCILGNIGGGLGVRTLANSIRDSKILQEANIFLLPTEASNGYLPFPLGGDLGPGPKPGSWNLGYRYSRDILTQLNNGAAGWIDWNLWLDTKGGPNHSDNNLDAPILVSETGTSFWLEPMYFHISHFSKYIEVGSVLVHSEIYHDGKPGRIPSLQHVALINPAETMVTVIITNDSLTKLDWRVKTVNNLLVRVWNKEGNAYASVHTSMPRFSIQTLIIPMINQQTRQG